MIGFYIDEIHERHLFADMAGRVFAVSMVL